MEEPGTQTPEGASPAQPFGDQPQEPAALQGCSRPVLIGCSAALLIAAVLFMLLIVKARDLFEWAFEQNKQQILEALPADVTPEDEERLRRALDGAGLAVTEGRIDARGLQELLDALSLANEKGEAMTREDVLEAIRALERVAGTPPPEDASLGLPPLPWGRPPPARALA